MYTKGGMTGLATITPLGMANYGWTFLAGVTVMAALAALWRMFPVKEA